MPDGIILQHPPARKFRCDFPRLAMPSAESEIKLIETIAKTKVIAIALSHENMDDHGILKVIEDYEKKAQITNNRCFELRVRKNYSSVKQKFSRAKA